MPAAADTSLLRFLRTRGHSASRDRAVAAFSRLGEHGSVWLAIAGVGALLDAERRPQYRRAALTVVTAYGANQLVKFAVRRPRPQLEGLPPLAHTMSRLSYPSAHSSTSVAGARALAEVLPAPPLAALALALPLSRLYLGVHYPSDVLAGAALGAAVAELTR